MVERRSGQSTALGNPLFRAALRRDDRFEVSRLVQSISFAHGDTLSASAEAVKHSTHVESQDFGRWLAKQLDRRDWKQADLVQRTRLSRSSVSDWITGKKIPDPKSCDLIADALGVDRDLVLALAGHRPPDTELDPDDPASAIIALVKQINWTEERAETITASLERMRKFDRRRSSDATIPPQES